MRCSALGFQRLAAHDAQSLVRLGWFVTWLVLALALAGFVLVLRRWESRWLLPMLVAGTYALFYFYKIRIYNDYYFALRRFMPVIVPVAAGPGRGGAGRALGPRPRAAASSPPLSPPPWPRCSCATRCPSLRYRDWNNSVRFVDDLARRFGPQDVVIFEQTAQRAPALAAAVGRARRERAGAGALQSRPRAAAAPRRRPGAGGIATSTSSTPTARTCAACSSSTSRT